MVYISRFINSSLEFKIFKSLYHRTIEINHQPDATVFQFLILMFIYNSKCFGCFPVHHQELMTAVAASGFTYFHKRYCIVNLLLTLR